MTTLHDVQFVIPAPNAARLKIRADREALRARLAAKLDPAMIARAEAVRDALDEAGYQATQGTGPEQHIVSVWRVSSSQKPKVDGITQQHSDPFYADVVHSQSFMTITLKVGREIDQRERRIRRRGDDGGMVIMSANGTMREENLDEHPKPLLKGGYDAL